jgi:hypothetical protein
VTATHAGGHHEPDYSAAIENLTARFGGIFTPDEVRTAVEEARARVEPESRVHDFLELLVERRALESLRARARGGDATPPA